MTVFSMASAKGGCGKTSLAILVGMEFALDGAKVVLLDCDLNQHAATVLHGSLGGRSWAISFHCYGIRTYSGRPSSSIRFKALTAIITSVARRRSVRDRSPSPMTRLKRLMSASTRARQL